jgi:hypothetical protein
MFMRFPPNFSVVQREQANGLTRTNRQLGMSSLSAPRLIAERLRGITPAHQEASMPEARETTCGAIARYRRAAQVYLQDNCLNGYKISPPSIFGTMTMPELDGLFRGYGYDPIIVAGPNQVANPQPGHDLNPRPGASQCSAALHAGRGDAIGANAG